MKTQIHLSSEGLKIVRELLDREFLFFPDNASVRDFAVAYALKNKLNPIPISNRDGLTWSTAQLHSDLIDIVKFRYPGEDEIFLIFEGLCQAGLVHMYADPNFKFWLEVSDLPRFSILKA